MSMNDADRRLASWLEAAAPSREPEHLLESVLERTARTRRRPAWRIPERWIPMTTFTGTVAVGRHARWPILVVGTMLLLALVAGVLLVAGSQRRVPPPFGPAANGAFAYEADGNIYAADATTPARLLAGDPGLDLVPQYSRDGTRFAWLHATDPTFTDATSNPGKVDLRVADADGSHARSLGQFVLADEPVWSPAGDRIAIASDHTGKKVLSVVDVASGKITTLDVGMEAEAPAFRPGSTQLVFRGRPTSHPWGFYLVNEDGTGLVALDLDPGFQGDSSYIVNQDYYFRAPAWSPDGRRLAYHTLEPSPTGEDPGWRLHVASIGADGAISDERLLEPALPIDDEYLPEWLPDGSGVLADRLEEGAHSLVLWTLGATPVERQLGDGMSPTPLAELDFALAPDGTSAVAWTKDRAWTVPVDGSPATPIDLPISNWVSWQRLAK